MAQPTEDERVQYGLVGVQAAKGAMGVVRMYDIFFTDKGVAFAVVASGLKMAAGVAGAASFGALGGAIAGGSISSGTVKMREQFQGLKLPQILKLNEKSFYLSYSEISQVAIKKGLTGIGKMDIFTADGKYHCEFSKNQIELANQAVAEKLAAKMTG
jgi:hypothetical protein